MPCKSAAQHNVSELHRDDAPNWRESGLSDEEMLEKLLALNFESARRILLNRRIGEANKRMCATIK